MRTSVVLNKNWSLTRVKSNLGGFGNSQVTSPGIVNQHIILDKLKPKEVEFRIVPDTVREYDITLDGPFTESLDVSYTRIGYELNFMNIDPIIFGNSEPSRKYMITEEKKAMESDRTILSLKPPRVTCNCVGARTFTKFSNQNRMSMSGKFECIEDTKSINRAMDE